MALGGMVIAAAQNSKCLTCHTGQATQPATAMANALDDPKVHNLLNAHPNLERQDGDYTYAVTSANGVSTYRVSHGAETLALPVKWAFGVHSQTWVLEYQNKLYESRVSFYPTINGLDLTMGDQKLHPARNLVEAMGREISTHEATRCFQCHATGAVTDDSMHVDALTPGVRCEHCHENTAEHFEAITHGKLTHIPTKLKPLPSEDIANFCGQCHRSFSDVVRDRLFGPVNVRFQPYRLSHSKCFNGGDPRISCVACHDPHHELVKSAATYEDKCLVCHGASAVSRPTAAKICSTGATTGCVGCHMPKIQLPGGNQVFTDHYIRIVRAGEKYPE